MTDSLSTPVPDSFSVSVLVEYRKARHSRWEDGHWQVAGVVAGSDADSRDGGVRQLHAATEGQQHLCSGLRIRLHRDDAESYYFNLVSDRPSLFVICSQEAGEPPRPFIATLSYGEATSYMETEELVESVDMPAELYRWAERFVLEHYVPEKRKKRKRDDWKAGGNGSR